MAKTLKKFISENWGVLMGLLHSAATKSKAVKIGFKIKIK
jgi:hypothetical protein